MNKPKYFIEMTPGCPGFPPREHTELMDDKPLYQLSRHAPTPLPPDLDGQLREILDLWATHAANGFGADSDRDEIVQRIKALFEGTK